MRFLPTPRIVRRYLSALSACLVLAGPTPAANAQAASELPAYAKAGAIAGSIKSTGSESMDHILSLWMEEFMRLHPTVAISHESAGSGVVPAALRQGQIQLGAMSRPMKPEEVAEFERAKGYRPLEIRVALDAIAVFVQKENPVRGLTLADLKAIYSTKATSEAKAWGELGLADEWSAKPVAPFGRDAKSGTRAYFQELALGGADFQPRVVAMPGPKSTLKAIGTTPGAVGYAGPESLTMRVRAVPIGRTPDRYVEPSAANCADQSYPLSRFFYLYIDRKPGTAPAPEIAAFLRFVLSREGQACVAKAGSYSLTAAVVQEERNKLN